MFSQTFCYREVLPHSNRLRIFSILGFRFTRLKMDRVGLEETDKRGASYPVPMEEAKILSHALGWVEKRFCTFWRPLVLRLPLNNVPPFYWRFSHPPGLLAMDDAELQKSTNVCLRLNGWIITITERLTVWFMRLIWDSSHFTDSFNLSWYTITSKRNFNLVLFHFDLDLLKYLQKIVTHRGCW